MSLGTSILENGKGVAATGRAVSSPEPRDTAIANNMAVPDERSAVCAFARKALEAQRLGLLVG